MRFAAQPDRAADGGDVAAEAPLPEPVSDDHDPPRVGDVVLLREGAAGDGTDAEHGEVLVRHLLAGDRLGLRVAGERRTPAGDDRDLLEEAGFAPPVGVVAGRGPFVGRTAARPQVLPDHHEPLRMRIGQRPEQDGVDDGEHRGVGADAERDRQDRDRGEPAGLEDGPDGIREVLNGGLHIGVRRLARRKR